METREFEVRAVEGEDRVIEGIAVPYNDTIDLGGYRERFQRGAFGAVSGVKLFYQHAEPIGRVDGYEDSEDGFRIRATISQTIRGDEVYTLLRDGVLDRFSVGFEPLEETRDDDGTVVRTRATLKEVSVVAFPAYQNAAVTAVRSEPVKETPVADEPTTEVVELRDAVADLDRRMAIMTDLAPKGDPIPQFRSWGSWIHALASGDQDAAELYTRAVTPVTDAAKTSVPDPIMINQWVSDVVRLIDRGRPTFNAFRNDPLPAEGNVVEWPQVKTDTIAVADQAAELDELTFGKLTLESKTSTVKTLGGYVRLTRQTIERGHPGYLETVFRAQAIAYAKHTNATVTGALAGLTGLKTATAAATTKGWLGAIADAAIAMDNDVALAPEFILADPTVWKKIVTLVDTTDRSSIVAFNPSNNTGSGNVPQMQASIAGLPVIIDQTLAAGSCYICNSEALVTYESGGAPFRLQHSNAINLSEEFSLYGYLAVGVPLQGGIVKVTAS